MSVTALFAVGADGFVRHIALAALDAVVDADLAHGTERLVVKRGDAQRGAELFVEFAKILQVRGQRGELQPFVGEEKLLIAGVPQARKLAVQHDGGSDGHLIEAVGSLAEFGPAAVFFHADYAARAADLETQRRQAFDGLRGEALFDIPHDDSEYDAARGCVKAPASGFGGLRNESLEDSRLYRVSGLPHLIRSKMVGYPGLGDAGRAFRASEAWQPRGIQLPPFADRRRSRAGRERLCWSGLEIHRYCVLSAWEVNSRTWSFARRRNGLIRAGP